MSNLTTKIFSESCLRVSVPPVLVLNLREKIEPDQLPVEELVVIDKEEHKHHIETAVSPYSEIPASVPIPKFTLEMTWSPSNLCFVLDEEPVTQRLRIWNCSNRPMYFLYCGLWGDMARLGASWCCYPRTRIWLSAGLTAVITVKATPREIAPIQSAVAKLQIAAGHMRDNVTGYFSIPIQAKFLKYIPPAPPEGEYYESTVF